ncbi:MAG: SH3 domain-containing protein [Saprospiraceae bacterium]|nr:SH3 domain-containing protein [Saprospiraceae bacterium]
MINKRSKKEKISWAFIFFLFPVFILAQDITKNFEEANVAYRNEDYSAAINLYEGLLTQGYTSSELHYNLGTSYLKIDSIALANLYLERALKLAPFDERIQSNLSLARSRVETDIYEVPQFVLKRIWDMWTNILSPNGWVVLQILLSIALLGFVYYWQFRTVKGRRNGIVIMIFGLLIVLIISLVSGAYAAHIQKAMDTGIVMSDEVLLSGPDPRSPMVQKLSSGVKVIVLDEIDNWLHVELLNKETGWIQEDIVIRI